MKTRKKISAKLLAIMLIAALLLPLAWNVPVEAAEAKQIDVLFSHDTHSHLNSFSTIVDGEQKEVGGFARIKTLIDEKKQEDPDTLVLDGGDFSMGTLIQTVYETEAAELRMLGYLGYDVTTLGNHEYDYRSKGLANMLETAKASGETVPALVVCNVDWDSMEQDGLSDGQKQIRSAFEAYGVKDYVVVQKGDVKAAVVGVFGKDALECAPTCELKFKDPVEAVKQTVEEIRKNEKVDMIACVSHGGTWEDENKSEDEILAKEVYLSVGRFGFRKRMKQNNALLDALKEAMQLGVDLNDEEQRNAVFDKVTFRVKYLDENSERLHGTCILNLANIKDGRDWSQIRGTKIATVFQDPMTSLNPIITIGKQITSVIMKHQDCTENEARLRALDLMDKVGIPNPEARFDDYPFQYSGGMRQRIVIAIALSCQPKILICDEPTTALDVTIQAQILKLLKDLQKEFNYTIVFITHDLGVVANIADRVAVLYAGQIVEVGTVEEVFYDPRHPYTWALLSSLPQLAERNTTLYSITGTPPSLYNSIVGDAFAPRNPYCMKIDTLEEPPMFKVTDTHYAKTWLLHPDAPKVEKPEGIQNIHEKLVKAFNI